MIKICAKVLAWHLFPPSLTRKYGNAAKQMSWQFLFPSSVRCTHPIDGYICRHHIHETSYAKYLRQAVSKSGVMKRVTAHTFRHSFIKYVLAFYPSGHPADVQI
jgi:integrase